MLERMARRSAEIGTVVWLLAMAVLRPSFTDEVWPLAILAFAPLVIVPLVFKGVLMHEGASCTGRLWNAVRVAQLPSALCFACGLCVPTGWTAGLLTLPWLLTSLMITTIGVKTLWREGFRSAVTLGISAGMTMLTIGAGWAVLSRIGIRPLEFEPIIVLLTAIHFHYAGFTLPILAGLAARGSASNVAWWVVVSVVLSVPAVAVGITSTRLGLPTIVETLAAWLMTFAGLLVSWSYWRLSHQRGWPVLARSLWRAASTFLTFGMVLAFMYGSRHLVEVGWLDIPWMFALHGTSNAFGFGLLALLGWACTAATTHAEAATRASILSANDIRG